MLVTSSMIVQASTYCSRADFFQSIQSIASHCVIILPALAAQMAFEHERLYPMDTT